MADKAQQQIDEQRQIEEQRQLEDSLDRAERERQERLEAERRADLQEVEDDRRAREEYAAMARAEWAEEMEEARLKEDELRVEALRSHPDPEVRAIGKKIWEERDRQQAAAEEQWETGGDGGEEAEREAAAEAARAERLARDPEPDPGWLARWEREGTLAALTPQEREKLRAIDREDPYGRSQREQFLPREVLAIRAKSDRMVEAREHEAGERQPGQVQEQKCQDLEQDDELELE